MVTLEGEQGADDGGLDDNDVKEIDDIEGYMADDDDQDVNGARKSRYTAFFTEPPTTDVPPFYSLENSEGKVMATWAIQTRCFDLDAYNVCNACHASMEDAEEDEDGKLTHKGDCLRVGNIIPSSRRTTQRSKYQAKNKKQVSLRDAVKMGGVGKLKRPFSTPTKQMPASKKGKEGEEGDNLDVTMDFDAVIDALGDEESTEGKYPQPGSPSSSSLI
jgi:hypothetical protein